MVVFMLAKALGGKFLFTRSNQFTLDFGSPISYTYQVLRFGLGGCGV
jgi:hypothetical protein